MKILLLVSAMQTGGAERVAATLCSGWARRGDAVWLVATYSGRGECHFPVDRRVNFQYLVDRINRPGGQIGGYARRILALRQLIREVAPDVVISFLTNVNVLAILASRGLRVPLIVCERIDPGVSGDSGPILGGLARLLYPYADMVTVQTESGLNSLLHRFSRLRRAEIVPNPIPDELIAVEHVPASADGRRRIVAAGRLLRRKQFDHLVKAFAAIARRFPDVDLYIWGDGPARPELEVLVQATGLDNRIRFPGRTDHPWQEMITGEVFVMTSAFEGFPNALLEAMALGLPCVVYDCPSGPREMTEDGSAAILLPLNDLDALTQSLADLLSDPARRASLGERASAAVRRRYTLTAVLARWDALIRAVRAGASSGAGAG